VVHVHEVDDALGQLLPSRQRDALGDVREDRVAGDLGRQAIVRALLAGLIWMISTGKNLHKRYEIPSMHCSQTPSSSLAR
jgi:hypothetical protein